eukprot:6536290-Alexandrium_andersonii.AAC.1
MNWLPMVRQWLATSGVNWRKLAETARELAGTGGNLAGTGGNWRELAETWRELAGTGGTHIDDKTMLSKGCGDCPRSPRRLVSEFPARTGKHLSQNTRTAAGTTPPPRSKQSTITRSRTP